MGDAGLVQGTAPGTRLTATFSEEGELSGSAGCNDYGATYTADRGAIEISDFSKRDLGLLEDGDALQGAPAGVMEQEEEFLEALASATRYRVDGEVLQLLRLDGTRVGYFGRVTR